MWISYIVYDENIPRGSRNLMLLFLVILFIIYLLLILHMMFWNPELRWDWNKIDTSNMKFPKSFYWGTATASHQVEGGCVNNNWHAWEHNKDDQGKSRIKDNQKSGLACDHWNRYQNDINLIKSLGITHYRLSLEWSKIQPSKNEYNEDVIDHYIDVVDCLLNENITPVITLHHFTNPIWFEDLGGFENENNIDYFVSFCKKIFPLFNQKVKIWCTINEPEVYAVMGYFVGVFPPGNKSPQLAVEVLKNLLIAHTRVYHVLKEMPYGNTCKIGLVKNIMQFDPYRRWHLLDWIVCHITNKIYNGIALSYLKTGKININYPFFARLTYSSENAALATDFFGLNYYSHNHLKFKFDKYEFFENKYMKNDIMTDMPYTIYAEGFYRAIKDAQKIGKPIIITENGIADGKDDRRSIFIQRYIYAMYRALQEGANIQGYFYWSLMDNFEWAEGYDMKFGLYEVDFKTQERTLRKGAKAFVDIIHGSK